MRTRSCNLFLRLVFTGALVWALATPAARAATYNADCNADPYALRNALIAIRGGIQNDIDVSGICTVDNVVLDVSGLTIQGPVGGTAEIRLPVTACGTAPASGLADAHPLTVARSQNVFLKRLVITGGRGLEVQDAVIYSDGLTVQNSLGHGINVSRGFAGLGSPPGSSGKTILQNNCGAGISVGAASGGVVLGDADIINNRVGAQVSSGGNLNLNALRYNVPGTILVQGNRDGFQAASGSTSVLTAGPDSAGNLSKIWVKDNAGFGGAAVTNSVVQLFGNVVIEHNVTAPSDAVPSYLRAAVAVQSGAVAVVTAGVRIVNNLGSGIAGEFRANVQLVGSPTTGVAVTGNTGGGVVLTHGSFLVGSGSHFITGNTDSDGSCDGTSHFAGDLGGFGVMKCANTERTKK
jgi:hypothetical protein